MRDHLGRQIDYMRISITDRCNLRCRYCMPEGVKCVPMEEILTLEECAEIAAWAASLGISKVKVTGGEPLVRLGCCDFIRMLKDIKGIEKVTITTNGILLERYLEELISAGIDGINISLDTLDPKLYRALTGGGDLEAVLRALEKTVKIRGDRQIPVKINAVSLDFPVIVRAGAVSARLFMGRGCGDIRFHTRLIVGACSFEDRIGCRFYYHKEYCAGRPGEHCLFCL